MPFIYGNRRQALLFPPYLEDYISADDPVRVYDAFVEQLAFASLGISLATDQVGAPPYDPKAMLKLLVYGYAYGIRSSRKLEQAVHHNLSFIWLVGGLKPDFKTIAEFRRGHREALADILGQCVRVCLKLNLIAGNTLFVDGTKISANASRHKNLSAEKAAQLLAGAEARIQAILAEAEACDQAEADQESLVHLPEELRQAKSRQAKMQAVIKELEAQGEKSLNLTDRDCRMMTTRRGTVTGYNLQAVVDDQNGLLVHTEVVDAATDRGQFVPQIEAAHEALGGKCKTACGDSGYADTSALKTLEDQGITVIVPSQEQARHRPQENPFGKDKFVYDGKREGYICPQGHFLRYRKTDRKLRQITYQITSAVLCRECPHFGVCTQSEQGRSIVRLVDEATKEVLAARFASAEGQAVYQRRQARVEHPFGHLKQDLGMRTFLLRGLKGVAAEAGLWAVGFNLKRMITLVGTPELLRAWQPA